MDWSGISSSFDSDLFRKTLSAYLGVGGVIDGDFLQPAFDCILTDWLIWLLYIIALCLEKDDLQRRAIEAEQIDVVLATIVRLERLAPALLEIGRDVANG